MDLAEPIPFATSATKQRVEDFVDPVARWSGVLTNFQVFFATLFTSHCCSARPQPELHRCTHWITLGRTGAGTGCVWEGSW